jgi:hypothetical protein
VPETILEAIRMGQFDFEPKAVESDKYSPCVDLPGTPAKLSALAERVRRGLPLWHPADRQDCEDVIE